MEGSYYEKDDDDDDDGDGDDDDDDGDDDDIAKSRRIGDAVTITEITVVATQRWS